MTLKERVYESLVQHIGTEKDLLTLSRGLSRIQLSARLQKVCFLSPASAGVVALAAKTVLETCSETSAGANSTLFFPSVVRFVAHLLDPLHIRCCVVFLILSLLYVFTQSEESTSDAAASRFCEDEDVLDGGNVSTYRASCAFLSSYCYAEIKTEQIPEP